mmetsp:Transcript_14323/g.49835  ORF Transcript_14323/g.49835 Transcript_14323/m.49835 type:complete len:307 (+) Transcript_14323:991-1911(+)
MLDGLDVQRRRRRADLSDDVGPHEPAAEHADDHDRVLGNVHRRHVAVADRRQRHDGKVEREDILVLGLVDVPRVHLRGPAEALEPRVVRRAHVADEAPEARQKVRGKNRQHDELDHRDDAVRDGHVRAVAVYEPRAAEDAQQLGQAQQADQAHAFQRAKDREAHREHLHGEHGDEIQAEPSLQVMPDDPAVVPHPAEGLLLRELVVEEELEHDVDDEDDVDDLVDRKERAESRRPLQKRNLERRHDRRKEHSEAERGVPALHGPRLRRDGPGAFKSVFDALGRRLRRDDLLLRRRQRRRTRRKRAG